MAALQAATVRAWPEAALVLIEAGADVNIMAGQFGTALQAASRYGHLELVVERIRMPLVATTRQPSKQLRGVDILRLFKYCWSMGRKCTSKVGSVVNTECCPLST